MSKVNYTNTSAKDKRRQQRSDLKAKYQIFRPYCEALDLAEEYGHSTYDVFTKASNMTYSDDSLNSIPEIRKDLSDESVSEENKKDLALVLASLEMRKALDTFTSNAIRSNKRVITRAYKECAELFLDQVKDNLKADFSGESQLTNENIKMFKSNREAAKQLNVIGENWRRSNTKGGEDPSKPIYECKKPGVEAVVSMLLEFYPMTVATGNRMEPSTLYFYDYDSGLFTPNEDYLALMINQLTGEVTKSLIDNVRRTLLASSDKLFPYITPPKYLIKLKNGIFNLITRKFEPDDEIFWTFTTSINCNYIPKKKIPQKVHKGYTFERLINDLANNNDQRARLLKQICKSLMTGVLPAPAIFIVCGQGGDGKSLFFDLMQEIIGVDNTAQVNFSMLSQPDKILSMVGAKFTYGTDNTNGTYVHDTGLLKAIATQNRWAFSRKYYEALFSWITTIMVQLCNEMPRMSETGVQMQRRLVAFKAENSHSMNGTADTSLPRLLQSEEYKEYILANILDEDKLPYYSDFNDVDRSLINDNLNAEDTIKQYLQLIWENGGFDGDDAILPLKILYTGYVEWCKSNSIDKIISVRSFHSRSQIYFEKLGFAKSKGTRRIKSLIADYGDLSNIFGSFAGLENIQDEYLDNSPSSYYYKVPGAKTDSSILDFEFRRKDLETTSYEYFGIADEIDNAISANANTQATEAYDILLYLKAYGKDKTLDELFETNGKTYLDLDEANHQAYSDYTSYRQKYLQPRIDKYEYEAETAYNRYIGYNEDGLDEDIDKILNIQSKKVNNGQIDMGRVFNDLATKHNKNNTPISFGFRPGLTNNFDGIGQGLFSDINRIKAKTLNEMKKPSDSPVLAVQAMDSKIISIGEKYLDRNSGQSYGGYLVQATTAAANGDYEQLDNIEAYLRKAQHYYDKVSKIEISKSKAVMEHLVEKLSNGSSNAIGSIMKAVGANMSDSELEQLKAKAGSLRDVDTQQRISRFLDLIEFEKELLEMYQAN